ncbi:MAG TPA: Ref family recombination enhancement nuclease [Solirubrobacterales bacterium]
MGPAERYTKVEARRRDACKAAVCVACVVRQMLGALPAKWVMVGHDGTGSLYLGLLEYHHLKSGNVRRGHMFGLGLCFWHHEGNQRQPPEGWTHQSLRDRYGPSLKDGARLFHETYGSDDELLALQDEILRSYHPGEPELCALPA